jgi:hypothetical protein
MFSGDKPRGHPDGSSGIHVVRLKFYWSEMTIPAFGFSCQAKLFFRTGFSGEFVSETAGRRRSGNGEIGQSGPFSGMLRHGPPRRTAPATLFDAAFPNDAESHPD